MLFLAIDVESRGSVCKIGNVIAALNKMLGFCGEISSGSTRGSPIRVAEDKCSFDVEIVKEFLQFCVASG